MRQSLYDYCVENNRIDLLQWDTDANLPLTPKTVTSGSSRKIWWFCEKGHYWQQEPWVRTAHQTECPICSGKKIVTGINDLKTLVPEVAAEWNYERNGNLLPETVSPFSHRKVWWKCDTCGYEWQAQVKSRAGSSRCGCPVCANKVVIPEENSLAALAPMIAAEWHPTRNGKLTPETVSAGSNRRAWWRCEDGHVWKAPINRRAGTQKSGCPVCAGRVNMARQKYYDRIIAEAKALENGSTSAEKTG